MVFISNLFFCNSFHTNNLQKISIENWRRTIDTNINSHFYFSKYAIPLLKKGSLIMVDDICWNYSNEPIEATKKFLSDYKEDYKLLLDVKTKYNQHPTFWNGYFIIEKI